jgi:hypothetical protein
MKYKPDKTTKILIRLSILITACFGAVVFYFVFKLRMLSNSGGGAIELLIYLQLLLGGSIVCTAIWLAATIFEPNNKSKSLDDSDDNL